MIAKDENLLVKVIKKAVGLPTGSSSCSCSTPIPAANDCCAAEAIESSTGECDCESKAPQRADEQAAQA